jgi:hypothetical protein
MRENRLRWFGHVMSQEETKAVRVVCKLTLKRKQKEEDQKRDCWIQSRMI